MRSPLAYIRYRVGRIASRIDDWASGPVAQNPVKMEWVGDDVSWRLRGIFDRVGGAIHDKSAPHGFARHVWNDKHDHEHCDACWAKIANWENSHSVTRVFFRNETDGKAGNTIFCPICFSLFSGVCAGDLEIQVTDETALLAYQKKDPDWQKLKRFNPA